MHMDSSSAAAQSASATSYLLRLVTLGTRTCAAVGEGLWWVGSSNELVTGIGWSQYGGEQLPKLVWRARAVRMSASVRADAKRSTARPQGSSHATMSVVWSPGEG